MSETFKSQDLFSTRLSRIPQHGFKGVLPDTIVPLAFGLPDPESFPIEGLVDATASMMRKEGRTALQYGPVRGHPGLLDCIRGRLEREEGLSVGTDNLMLTNGSTQALELIARLFLDPQELMVVESPTFLGAVRVFHACDVRTTCVPIDENGIKIDSLDRKLAELKAGGESPKIVYVLPNFHNPAGVTMPVENRVALLQVAEKHGVMILEDDAYADLRYDGPRLPSLYSLDGVGCVIRIGTFSKILAAGMRLGWALAKPELIAKLSVMKLDTGTNPFGAHVAAAFCQAGLLDPHVERLISIYREKRDAMLGALEEFCSEQGRWTRPDGGFFVWLELPEKVDAAKLVPQATEEGVTFLPGEACFADGSGKNYIRLSFSYPSPERIREGVKRLSKVLDNAIQTPA